jgi:hypothetical protein
MYTFTSVFACTLLVWLLPSEHCVFARFLSEGDSYRDCGQPCETTRVHLRDGDGSGNNGSGGNGSGSSTALARDHLVLADMGCRNTVFDARAQTAAPYLAPMLAAGVRSFRVGTWEDPNANLQSDFSSCAHDAP